MFQRNDKTKYIFFSWFELLFSPNISRPISCFNHKSHLWQHNVQTDDDNVKFSPKRQTDKQRSRLLGPDFEILEENLNWIVANNITIGTNPLTANAYDLLDFFYVLNSCFQETFWAVIRHFEKSLSTCFLLFRKMLK